MRRGLCQSLFSCLRKRLGNAPLLHHERLWERLMLRDRELMHVRAALMHTLVLHAALMHTLVLRRLPFHLFSPGVSAFNRHNKMPPSWCVSHLWGKKKPTKI